MFRNIILICTGNICRSPMAEALLVKQLANLDIQVSSAGTAALLYHPADPHAQQTMSEHGFDITGHRARQATRELLIQTDLILTLDQSHSDWIRGRFPELQGRVHKFGRWRNNIDIFDPYGWPKAAFDKVYDDISGCAEDWGKRVGAV